MSNEQGDLCPTCGRRAPRTNAQRLVADAERNRKAKAKFREGGREREYNRRYYLEVTKPKREKG